MTPKVSVIIPVYNVEKHIEKCCRSLFGQTLEDMEFLFVDDCSPDNSIAAMRSVLEEYPQRKSQVKIIRHDTNRGVSSVRNTGTKAAAGDYIIHCDSDDWVDPSMYEKMHTQAEAKNADMVWCDILAVYSSHSQLLPQDGGGVKCPKSAIRALLASKMHGSSCNKLVKRKLIYDNKITYPDGNNIFEDFIVSVEMFYFARKISYIPEALYFYNKTNSGSLLTVKKVQSTCQAIENIERLCVFFEEKHIAAAYEKELAWTKLFAKTGLLEYRDKLKEWREIFKEANKHILSHPAFPAKVKAYQWCMAHRIWIAYYIKHLITKIRGKP